MFLDNFDTYMQDNYNEQTYNYIEQKFMENDPMNPNNPYSQQMNTQDRLKFHHENVMQIQNDFDAGMKKVQGIGSALGSWGSFSDMPGVGMLPM